MIPGRRGLRPRLDRARGRATRRSLRRPRVTVIIPTYNWSTVLPYSIASVIDQTMDDLELWVIGDGCTDDDQEWLQERHGYLYAGDVQTDS